METIARTVTGPNEAAGRPMLFTEEWPLSVDSWDEERSSSLSHGYLSNLFAQLATDAARLPPSER